MSEWEVPGRFEALLHNWGLQQYDNITDEQSNRWNKIELFIPLYSNMEGPVQRMQLCEQNRRFAFLLYYCCKLKTWLINKPFSQKPQSPGSICGNKVHIAIWDAYLKDHDNRTIWFSHPWDAVLTMSSGLFSGFQLWTLLKRSLSAVLDLWLLHYRVVWESTKTLSGS